VLVLTSSTSSKVLKARRLERLQTSSKTLVREAAKLLISSSTLLKAAADSSKLKMELTHLLKLKEVQPVQLLITTSLTTRTVMERVQMELMALEMATDTENLLTSLQVLERDLASLLINSQELEMVDTVSQLISSQDLLIHMAKKLISSSIPLKVAADLSKKTSQKGLLP